MRTVFNNDMCAHVWAAMSQPHGKSDSMRFDGVKAYSYWAHVATLQRTSESDPRSYIALFSEGFERYSPTTGRHVSLYKAASRQFQQFTVPDIDFAANQYQEPARHAKNVAHLVKCYTAERDALMRSPCDSHRVVQDRVVLSLEELAGTVRRYCDAFKLPQPQLKVETDTAAIVERRDRLINDPKREAKREASRLARERAEAHKAEIAEAKRIARIAECAEHIAKWRAGLSGFLPYDAQRATDGSYMLRVVGDMVETSGGAEAPLEHVKRALELYDTVPRGIQWDRKLDAPKDWTTLGHFQLDRINSDRSIVAGCHTITAREIEQLRSALS